MYDLMDSPDHTTDDDDHFIAATWHLSIANDTNMKWIVLLTINWVFFSLMIAMTSSSSASACNWPMTLFLMSCAYVCGALSGYGMGHQETISVWRVQVVVGAATFLMLLSQFVLWIGLPYQW